MIENVPMQGLAISCITEAEIKRGLAKKPEATRLALVVSEYLVRVECLPWGSQEASAYAKLRTECDKAGRALGTMDMLIGAHAWALGATLITNDQAFFKFPVDLMVEDWS